MLCCLVIMTTWFGFVTFQLRSSSQNLSAHCTTLTNLIKNSPTLHFSLLSDYGGKYLSVSSSIGFGLTSLLVNIIHRWIAASWFIIRVRLTSIYIFVLWFVGYKLPWCGTVRHGSGGTRYFSYTEESVLWFIRSVDNFDIHLLYNLDLRIKGHLAMKIVTVCFLSYLFKVAFWFNS